MIAVLQFIEDPRTMPIALWVIATALVAVLPFEALIMLALWRRRRPSHTRPRAATDRPGSWPPHSRTTAPAPVPAPPSSTPLPRRTPRGDDTLNGTELFASQVSHYRPGDKEK